MLLFGWYRDRMMKQFLMAASLLIGVGLTATWLYFNATWRVVSHSLLLSWGRHML